MFSDKPVGVGTIDLNADVGEHDIGSQVDDAIMPLITSANIACGFHAGSPAVMRRIVELALSHNVGIGAHPSFDDRQGFGRTEQRVPPKELEALVAYQIGALAGIAALLGGRVRHVKPHGALFNMAARNRQMADAVARAAKAVDPALILFGPPQSELTAAGTRAGLATAGEAFADRAYLDDGSLQPRTQPGAVLHDPEAVAGRAVAIAVDRAITSASGARVPLDAQTICVHGDTPGAASLLRHVREALAASGIEIRTVGA